MYFIVYFFYPKGFYPKVQGFGNNFIIKRVIKVDKLREILKNPQNWGGRGKGYIFSMSWGHFWDREFAKNGELMRKYSQKSSIFEAGTKVQFSGILPTLFVTRTAKLHAMVHCNPKCIAVIPLQFLCNSFVIICSVEILLQICLPLENLQNFAAVAAS